MYDLKFKTNFEINMIILYFCELEHSLKFVVRLYNSVFKNKFLPKFVNIKKKKKMKILK